MRFNSMIANNDRNKTYLNYIVIAVGLAFVVFFFLNILIQLFIMAVAIFIKNWWIVIVVILGLLFLRKFLGKKK